MEGIKEILNQYDISEMSPVTFIRESSDNAVYCIGDKDRKILRISKRLSLSDVQFEFEVMDHLSKSGVPVAKWVRTRNNSFYASTSEITIAVLFDFVDGVHTEVSKDKMPSLRQAYEAGKMLGRIHIVGQSFVSSSNRSRDIFTELKRVIANAEIFDDPLYEGGKQFVEDVKEAIEFAKVYDEPQGFIHNDYRVGNVFFQKNDPDKIQGVIDFDWGCMGTLDKDLALALMEWSFPDGAESPDFSVLNEFLAGYYSETDRKIKKGGDINKWMWFAGLSDTATWLCDNLSDPNFRKKVDRSYMYRKAQFFKYNFN